MPAPPAAHWQQLQQPMAAAGSFGTAMPAFSLLSPAQPPSATFTLATAKPPIRDPNVPISRRSPVPTRLRKQILDGSYVDLALLLIPFLHQPSADRFSKVKMNQVRQPIPGNHTGPRNSHPSSSLMNFPFSEMSSALSSPAGDKKWTAT